MKSRIRLPTLIELNDSKAEAKVFCLHTAGGGVSFYDGIAKELAGVAKFYGLEEPIIYDDFEYDSIPELAEYHIDTIKSVQKNGPYTLFGYCSGGPIAFEVAFQLALAGEQIDRVVLFGSSIVGFDREVKERYLFLKDYLSIKFNLDLNSLDWASFEVREHEVVAESIIDELIRQQVEGVTKEAEWIRKGIQALYMMREASKKYSPNMAIFTIDLYDRYLEDQVKKSIVPWCNWDDLTQGKLNYVAAPELKGGHNDILFPPYIDVTVEQLKFTTFNK
jgi:thioesterase domain-containing protein